MTIVGEAFIRIRPDDAGFSNEAEKGILSKVGGIASKAAGVFAAGFAIKQGADFFGGLIADASESRRVLAETEQAIKATGGAANVSAGQISDLADSLSKKTGIDDEAIQTGENLLLTFKNIRNETGKGNDIFNQATAAVLDLSKQFGGIEASSVQVGKALNDPIAGVTALTRVGIQFTEAQKDQIKALVETGDTLGAQKIIMGEINAQVGGQAAAQATAADKLRVVWGNLREELGARLLPIVDKVATFLADRLPGALDKVGKVLGPVVSGVKAAIDGIVGGFQNPDATFGPGFGKTEKFFIQFGQTVNRVVTVVRDAITGLFAFITQGDFTGAFARAFHVEEDSPIVAFLFRLREAFFNLVSFVRDNVQPILIAVGAAFLLSVGPVVAIGAALILLYTRFQVVRDVIGAVADFLTGTVIPAIAAFVGFVSEQFSHLADFVRENWASIQEAISHVVNVVQGIITAFVTVVQVIWRAWGDEILSVVRTVWDQMRNVVETVIAIIAGLIQAGLALINGDWGAAWDAIKGILSAAWDFMVGTVSNALSIIQSTISAAWDAVSAVTSAAWDAIKGAVEVAMRVILAAVTLGFSELTIAIVQHRDDIVGFIGELPGRIRDALGDLGSLLFNAGKAIMAGLKDGIVAGFKAVADFVGGIAGKIADLKGPLDYDKRLLIPAGVAIMRGLEQGIASQERSLEERLKSITSLISGVGTAGELSVVGRVNGGVTGALSGTPGLSTGTTALNITGPLVVVQGGVVPGQEASIGAAVRQAVTQLVADGTVGRAIAKRRETFSTR